MTHTADGHDATVKGATSVREVLRWLYFPYKWIVFIPTFGVLTFLLGVIATGMSALNPRMAFHCGTIWGWLTCRLNWMWVSVKGRSRADKTQSYVIMINHQSHFDVLAFYGHWGRQFRWVLKEELRKVPGLGWYCQAGGHVFVDRRDRQKAIESLERAKPRLVDGVSVVFFPEGSRSKDGRMKAFKKGGFMMALDLGLPILPISISGTRHVLPGRSMKLLPGKVTITVHDPIDATKYGHEGRDELMADVRAAIASGLTPYERGSEG